MGEGKREQVPPIIRKLPNGGETRVDFDERRIDDDFANAYKVLPLLDLYIKGGTDRAMSKMLRKELMKEIPDYRKHLASRRARWHKGDPEPTPDETTEIIIRASDQERVAMIDAQVAVCNREREAFLDGFLRIANEIIDKNKASDEARKAYWNALLSLQGELHKLDDIVKGRVKSGEDQSQETS